MTVRVRYTGARTGLAGLRVPGVGVFQRGEEYDLPDELAARWLRAGGDFERVEQPPEVEVEQAPVEEVEQTESKPRRRRQVEAPEAVSVAEAESPAQEGEVG